MRWRRSGSRRSPRWRTATAPARPILAARPPPRRPPRSPPRPARPALRRADQGAGAQLRGQRQEAHRQLPGSRGEPADPPPRGRMRHLRPGSGRADPAPAGHLHDHAADTLGRVQPPGQRKRRQQRVSRPADAAPDPRHEDLPAPPLQPDMPPVPGPEHHPARASRAIRPQDLYRRPADAYSSTVSGHGHTIDMANQPPRIPSRNQWPKPGEKGSSH